MADKKKVVILISNKVFERLRKDRFIRDPKNKKWYLNTVTKIAENKLNYPTETIGDFYVSPRGHENRRIVWRMELKDDIIYIYIEDFLYHEGNHYIEDWGTKVKKKQIRVGNYGSSPKDYGSLEAI